MILQLIVSIFLEWKVQLYAVGFLRVCFDYEDLKFSSYGDFNLQVKIIFTVHEIKSVVGFPCLFRLHVLRCYFSIFFVSADFLFTNQFEALEVRYTLVDFKLSS